jgi:hypothetical protein
MTTNIIRTLETTLIETLAQHASPLLNETHGKVCKAVEFLLPNLVGVLTKSRPANKGGVRKFASCSDAAS